MQRTCAQEWRHSALSHPLRLPVISHSLGSSRLISHRRPQPRQHRPRRQRPDRRLAHRVAKGAACPHARAATRRWSHPKPSGGSSGHTRSEVRLAASRAGLAAPRGEGGPLPCGQQRRHQVQRDRQVERGGDEPVDGAEQRHRGDAAGGELSFVEVRPACVACQGRVVDMSWTEAAPRRGLACRRER